MNQVNLLRQTLKPHLGWHGARLNFLAQSQMAQIVPQGHNIVFNDWRRFTSRFLIALLRVKTINLTELATGFRSKAQTDSSAGLSPHRLRSRLERECVRSVYKDSSAISI